MANMDEIFNAIIGKMSCLLIGLNYYLPLVINKFFLVGAITLISGLINVLINNNQTVNLQIIISISFTYNSIHFVL